MIAPPLTDTERVQIKRALGYHSVPQSYYPLVEGFYSLDSVLNAIDLSAGETMTEVRAILANIAATEAAINAARANLTLVKAEDVTFRGPEELSALWTELKRWRRELSILIGIPLRHGAGLVVV